MKNKKSIRLPNDTVQLLRDLRDSHITPVAIPELIRRCLKQTKGVVCDDVSTPTTRTGSSVVTVFLDDEDAALEHSEITNRIHHALQGMEEKLCQIQIQWNRGTHPEFTKVES